MKICDNTKLKGDRLQDAHAPLVVRVLYHKNVASMSNLKMILGPALHSLTQLEAYKT